MLTKAVNDEPSHPPGSSLALEKAAIALERINRFESCGHAYQRIIDEVGAKEGVHTGRESARLLCPTRTSGFGLQCQSVL